MSSMENHQLNNRDGKAAQVFVQIVKISWDEDLIKYGLYMVYMPLILMIQAIKYGLYAINDPGILGKFLYSA